jgi:sulfur carrier protein
MPIQITLNGKPETLESGTVLSQLLEAKGVQTPRVAVELNRRILRREEFPTTEIKEGDRLEVVTLVGGGSRP